MSNGAGEKTEKASPKKKRDARERGEVFKSNDLISSATMLIGFSALKSGFTKFILSMQEFMQYSFATSAVQASDVTKENLPAVFKTTLTYVLPIILPLFLIIMISGSVLNVVQTGPLLTLSKLKPSFSKINMFKGFKRIFSANNAIETGKSLLKITVITALIYQDIYDGIQGYMRLMYTDIMDAFTIIMNSGIDMGIKIGAGLLGFSFADILYQWWRYNKDLMMTKQEVKEENKQTEGNPQIKGKIRQTQRKMSTMRMMQNLSQASVVVTNPTHYAVALRYNKDEDRAPVVIAKGQDYLAQRIKDKAKELKIKVVEDKLVARTLYQSCDIDEEIPPELYQAVAEILVTVYRSINGI
jgi:flagellar biosynthetic protein FlhB